LRPDGSLVYRFADGIRVLLISTWKLGVTSESQNNPVSTNGVNSVTAQSVKLLRKIRTDLKTQVKQQALRVPPFGKSISN